MEKKFDSHKFMELAIEVMRQSVPELRTDGKAGPKVGAVLVKPDGTVETAGRGELRHGGLAEFTHMGDECLPDALFAQGVVQKALETDNGARGKCVW